MMEETSLEDAATSAQPLKKQLPLSKTPAKVMTAEEGRLYFKEKREKKEAKDRVTAERQKKFDSNLHTIYKSYPIKLCTYISFFLINVLPFGAIIIGIMYIKEEHCPADNIAIAMILIGIFGALTTITHLYASWKEKKAKRLEKAKQETAVDGAGESNAGESSEPTPPKAKLSAQFKKKLAIESCVSILFKIIEICIFIYACVIVFRLFSHVQYEKTENSEFYCNKVLYRYAFWSLASGFIFFGLWFGMACALGCFGAWYVHRSVSDSEITVQPA